MLKYAVPVAAAGVLVAGFAVAPAPGPGVRIDHRFARAQEPVGHPRGAANPSRPDIRDARAEAPGGVRNPDDNEIIEEYCVRCHNERRLLGNMSLEEYDAANAPANGELTEKMIRKLRAGLMPPPGNSRPDHETLLALVESLEGQMDRAAAERPNPGHRTFQRLNRAEYGASIRDLLDLEIDPGAYLPLDTKSANFDNIADAQLLSATLTDGYLRAAAEISRLAIGDPHVTPSESTYRVSRWDSQSERVEGAPYGTRGGVSVMHNFPADGYYEFRVSFHHETTGALVGNGRNALHTEEGEPELLEISIDGEPAEVLEVNRWMHASDPDGLNIRSGRVFVRAGPRQVSAAFVRRFEGPLQDLISPHDWSLASTSIAGSYGFTVLPHLRDLAIGGPYDPQGVSETPSRAAVFSCRPGPEATEAEARACAREIVTRLGSRAYRRPLSEENVAGLMGLYGAGAAEEGFEGGVRTALEGILASPHFVFRIEEPGGGRGPRGRHIRGSPPGLPRRQPRSRRPAFLFPVGNGARRDADGRRRGGGSVGPGRAGAAGPPDA